ACWTQSEPPRVSGWVRRRLRNIIKPSVSTTYPPATAGGTDPVQVRRINRYKRAPGLDRVSTTCGSGWVRCPPSQVDKSMQTLLNDLRYGAKMLWKSKGGTLVAVISLAVGIGANSAIFSLINSIFLRPRAISRPDEVVELYAGEGEQPYQSTSYPSYLELRDRN